VNEHREALRVLNLGTTWAHVTGQRYTPIISPSEEKFNQ